MYLQVHKEGKAARCRHQALVDGQVFVTLTGDLSGVISYLSKAEARFRPMAEEGHLEGHYTALKTHWIQSAWWRTCELRLLRF
jgi:hypothetical protein